MTNASQMLISLSEVLSGCGNFANHLHEQTGFLPAEGSQAHDEWNSSEADKGEIQTTYSKSAVLLAAAENHLEGTARQLQEPIPHVGIYATTRAALENSCRSWWLFDPDISHRDRAGRGLAERFYSFNEAAKVEGAMRADDPTLKPEVIDKTKRVVASAESQGFEVTKGRNGYRVTGYARKGTTELLRLMHDEVGGVVYRYLSAAVHGTTYALLQDYEYEKDEEGGMGYVAKPNNDFGLIGLCIATTVLTYCRAFDRQVCLYGWRVPEWTAWRLHALSVVRPFAPLPWLPVR